MKKSLSLSKKIVGLVVLTGFIFGFLTLGMVYYLISKGYNKQAETEIGLTAEYQQQKIERDMETLKKQAAVMASNAALVAAMKVKDKDSLRGIAKDLMLQSGMDFVTLGDLQGIVLARGHSDKAGDSVMSQVNVRKALAGETSTGIEEGTEVKFSMRAGAPIKDEGRIIGTVSTGINLTSTNAYVEEIKQNTGLDCTIFQGDTRISTTLERNGKRLVGTKMDNSKVIETVLQKGQRFLSQNKIVDKNYNTAYWPLFSPEGKITGMFFIGKDRSLMESMIFSTMFMIMVAIFLVGCLMAALGYYLAVTITRPILWKMGLLNQIADEVSTAADQFKAVSQNLADGSSVQASSLEETSSSLEEMSSMTKQNAENAQIANDMMSKEAGPNFQLMTERMSVMEKAMQASVAASSETAKVIKTIDEIAFQTNLLALNAAVEAARAGEAGAGFAVVADEVRNLAMRSTEAAKNTQDLISNSTERIKEATGIYGQVSEVMEKNGQIAKKVTDLIGEIAAASQEQAHGIAQVNIAVTEMDKVTQQAAANAEESASASEELNAQAEQMKSFVAELSQVVGGSNHDGAYVAGNAGSYRANKSGGRFAKKGMKAANLPSSGKGKALALATGRSGHGRVIDPNQVIPMDEAEFKDF